MKTGLVLLVAVLLSIPAIAQDKNNYPHLPAQTTIVRSDVMARLSYKNTLTESSSGQVCFALYRSGYYRLFRLTENGSQTVHGYLPENQFAEARRVLNELPFSSNRSGITHNGMESLVAELYRAEGVVNFKDEPPYITRLVWVNPDGDQPLPISASKVVNWLQAFKPKHASILKVGELDPTCPSASLKNAPMIAGY
jgi:hypothetical protein